MTDTSTEAVERFVNDKLLRRHAVHIDRIREHLKEQDAVMKEAAVYFDALLAERDALRAKLDAQGRELNRTKYGEPDFSWSIHKAAMADLQTKLDVAVAGLKEAEAEIDDYIIYEYPSDHPVQERYRKRDFAANPARIALAQLTKENEG